MKSIKLIISGKVQGVFFRANVINKAVELGLKGYAKNLSNGTVEVIAQGDEEKISELVNFIKRNPGKSVIDNIKITETNSEKFKNFEIL